MKATGTGGAPRCHPDYEQNKMSNINFETRFPFIYASTSLDTKTSTIASNRNFGSCMLIRCLRCPSAHFPIFSFLLQVFRLPLATLPIIVAFFLTAPLSDRDKKRVCHGLLLPRSLYPSSLTPGGPVFLLGPGRTTVKNKNWPTRKFLKI